MASSTSELQSQLKDLAREVLAIEPGLRRGFLTVQKAVVALGRQLADSERRRLRAERLLSHSLRLGEATEAANIGTELLDAIVSMSGATRGFVGLVDQRGGWRFLAARELAEADIDNPDAMVSSGVIQKALATGEAVLADDAAAQGAFAQRMSVQRLGLRSVACLPIRAHGRVLGFVYIDNPEATSVFDREVLRALDAWLPLVAEHLSRALQAAEEQPFEGYITRSPALLAELRELSRLSRFNVPVLITGPTGTGKSMLAAAIHKKSRRADGPFIHVNCSAIPETLLDGELFGAEAGAYTGARGKRIGRFEAAHGGTLFLDEIDTMPISGQVKLLVALQENKITPLGSNRARSIDVRILAASNADPQQAIAEGRLREDLYFRLAKVEARLPPLSDRPEDLPALVQHILTKTSAEYGLPRLRLSPPVLEQVLAHRWPGNVRELDNILVRAALLASESGVIDSIRIPGAEAERPPRRLSVSREEFLDAWERSGGVVAETARILGVKKRSGFRLKKKFLPNG